MTTKKRIAYRAYQDVEFTGENGDAGLVFRVLCPDCSSEVRIAPYGWWDTKCQCGLTWTLKLYAEGVREED